MRENPSLFPIVSCDGIESSDEAVAAESGLRTGVTFDESPFSAVESLIRRTLSVNKGCAGIRFKESEVKALSAALRGVVFF